MIRLLAILFFLFCASTGWARTLYEIMGVERSADVATLKAAHRALARKYHPDLNPGDATAEAKFKEMQNAYDILSNPNKRASYDAHGTTEFRASTPRSGMTEEEVKRYREAKDARMADEMGAKHSNKKWTYEPKSHRFYDNRTKKWLSIRDGNFYSAEGYLFYPHDGRYYSTDLGADFYPEDGNGWHRRVDNGSDEFVKIDPKTGFSLSAKYEPGTISDASDLFDQILNPVSVADDFAGRGNRAELLKQLKELPWTPEQKADYIARAKAHIKILARRDMQAKFTTHHHYVESFMKAIIDNPVSMNNPEIVVDFIHSNPSFAETLSKNILMKDEWRDHANAPVWLEELFSREAGAQAFIEASFPKSNTPADLVKQFKKAYPTMLKAGLTPETSNTLVNYVGRYEPGAYEFFKPELLKLARSPAFLELISGVDPKYTANLVKFLDWLKQHDPQSAQIFSRALAMPGTKRDDYWRITPDRTENRFHESEFIAARKRSMQARMQFLQGSLPNIAHSSSGAGAEADCMRTYVKFRMN
jgi:curved DNA-binding protein CbpA